MKPRVNATGFPLPEDFGEWEKYFPTQPLNTSLFAGKRDQYERAVYSQLVQQLGLRTSVEDLDLVAPEEWTVAQMGSGRLHLQFLQFLVKFVGAKRVLEIGTFAGLSAIMLAHALPSDGQVITIEKFPKFANLAKENIRRNGFESKIEVITGDARSLIAGDEVAGSFDFVFVDGDKGHYLDYVKFALSRLSANGLIAIDDVFFQGDVFNDPPTTEKGRGVKEALDWVTNQPDLASSVVPLANGVMLVRKTSKAS